MLHEHHPTWVIKWSNNVWWNTEQLHSDNSLARDEIQCTSVKEEEHEDKHSVKLKQLCSSCSKKAYFLVNWGVHVVLPNNSALVCTLVARQEFSNMKMGDNKQYCIRFLWYTE